MPASRIIRCTVVRLHYAGLVSSIEDDMQYADIPTWTIILVGVLSFSFGFEFGRMYTKVMDFFYEKRKR